MSMRLAIVGSRDCPPINFEAYLPFRPRLIISGGARGADSFAKRYAFDNNIPIVEYLPKYHLYGRKAPILRNIQIVENCDYLIAFWDGRSPGTRFTLDYARRTGKPCKIIYV